MRWLSSFAILVYLSLLCTPQALAVHDTRLSPLADTQLLALNPALLQHTLTQQDEPDDEPPAAVVFTALHLTALLFACAPDVLATARPELYRRAHQPRAPPVFSLS